MDNQKKNNSALIIVIVLICVFLFFALVGFGGYYAYKSIIKPKISETKKDITTPSTKDTKDKTSSKSNSSSAKDAKVAGKDSPLAIKEWGLASKYAGKYLDEEYADKTYIDVPVRVTKVSRGEKIISEVKSLLADHRYKYEDPKSSQLEWAIVEYEVDLTDVKFGGSLGTNIKIDSDIKGSDGGTVKYDGISYFISTRDMSSSEYVKEPGVYTGKFVTQLPKGCSDYLIKFGNSYNGAESYFKGE